MNVLPLDEKDRFRVAALLTVIWLAAVSVGFWWFNGRFIVPFESDLVTFNGDSLAQLDHVALEGITVVAVMNRDCPCTGFAQSHWQELQQHHPTIHFERASANGPWQTLLNHVAVTPAVAVYEQSGRLVYFGPFSGGAICGSGEDYVAMALEALATNEYFHWINQDAVGCFCQRKLTKET